MKKNTTITIETKSGTTEIRLPENYINIFEDVATATENEKKNLYDRFTQKYLKLKDFEKEMYQDIVNSGKYPTETLVDLLEIFKVIEKYFLIENAETYEEIGRLYASVNKLEYVGPMTNNMLAKYIELGKGVCEMFDGFFASGKFYGKMR